MSTWGDTHLLMCQYTLHTHISSEESLDFPCTISAVYHFLTPDMADKLWKMASSSNQLQYLWVRLFSKEFNTISFNKHVHFKALILSLDTCHTKASVGESV